ncbi:hypothetical protein Tco_0879526, partial [Tanacetum coccineum]
MASLPASNNSDDPAKPPQIFTTNTLQKLKLPFLQKDVMITSGRWEIGTFILQTNQFADENERKARTLLLLAVPKDISRCFHCNGDAKSFGQLSKRQGKLSERFLRSLPPAWDSLAMTMRTKKNIDTLSIDDLYNNLSVFEQDIQKTSSSSLTSDNVAFISQAKASSSKHKPSQSSGSYSSYTTSSSKAKPTATPGLADEVIHSFLATNADDVDLIHEDLDQIDDLDLEEMDINCRIAMTAIKIKKKVENVSIATYWAFCSRECKFKVQRNGSRQEADQLGLEKIQMRNSIMLHGYTVIRDPGYYDIPLYSRFKQVEYKGVPHPLSGDYTPREQEDIDDSLYEYGKHGPQPKSPSPTVSNAGSIVFSICPSHDSDGELGTVSDASSTHYSTCQSNDSDGELGTEPNHSEQVSITTQKTQSQVPEPQQTVDPSCAQHVKTPRQPIRTPVSPSPIPSTHRQNWNQRMERELGAGYSFERKSCFVCGSLSHLIKDCDYYEKKMAREAAFKSTGVIQANVRQATPAWTNTNRVNKANQFTPRPVQLNNIRPNFSTASRTIKTGRVNVNTGKQHVNSGSMYVNSGTKNKSGGSRVNTGKQNVNSGRVHVNTARVTSPVLTNQTSQVNFKSSKTCFSKQRSPENRLFTKNTAYKSNNYAVKGKMGTAVKTSAGCVWRKTTLHSNTNSGPTPDSN